MVTESYSEEELDIICRYYEKGVKEVVRRLPGRSYAAVAKKASRLGLSRPTLSWSAREDAVLRDCLRKGFRPAEARRRLQMLGCSRTYCAVQSRMRDLKRAMRSAEPTAWWEELAVSAGK